MASSSSSYNTPCAACKFLRRKCLPGCIFSPYFPPEEPQKFANVHKIFGASNVTKLLNDLLPHQREDAVNSLAYEAEARVRDPVFGCVGAISYLQRQIERLQKELEVANADLIRYACNEITTSGASMPLVITPHNRHNNHTLINYHDQVSTTGNGNTNNIGGFINYRTPSFSFPNYPSLPWNGNNPSGDIIPGGNSGNF